MTHHDLTRAVIFGSAIALVLYNCAIGWLSDGQATISVEMQRLGHKYPMIVGAWLALAAHWWWEVGRHE